MSVVVYYYFQTYNNNYTTLTCSSAYLILRFFIMYSCPFLLFNSCGSISLVFIVYNIPNNCNHDHDRDNYFNLLVIRYSSWYRTVLNVLKCYRLCIAIILTSRKCNNF